MAIHETQWSPDTCGCILVYRWDDEEPPATREHRLAYVERVCLYHGDDAPDVLFEKVKKENQGKNKAFGEARKIKPEINADNYKWDFDTDGVLQVEFEGVDFSESEKRQLQSALNSVVGNKMARVV